jgi:hypothetical protein
VAPTPSGTAPAATPLITRTTSARPASISTAWTHATATAPPILERLCLHKKKIVSRAMVVVWLVVAVMCVIYRCIPLLLVHAACVSSCIWILEVLCERYPTLRYKADYRSLRNGSRINCISTLELPLSCNLSPSPTPLRCGPHVHVPWLRVPAPASACALERR